MDNLYSTSDLALAAAVSLYYPIKSIDKKNPSKVYFIFEKDKKFDLIVECYWRSDLKVDPQKYFNSIKALKNRIYNT
ncbi:MAG: DUF5659 domain-containing protein [Candidatus Humimicrobiaceae bacterium]